MIVKLFTEDGRFVDTVELAPYKIAPKIVAYGERLFVFSEPNYYREAFVAVPIATGVKKQ